MTRDKRHAEVAVAYAGVCLTAVAVMDMTAVEVKTSVSAGTDRCNTTRLQWQHGCLEPLKLCGSPTLQCFPTCSKALCSLHEYVGIAHVPETQKADILLKANAVV